MTTSTSCPILSCFVYQLACKERCLSLTGPRVQGFWSSAYP